MIIGIAVLIGWFIHNDFLRTLIAGQVTMKFNTALCFVLSSFVLLINHFWDKTKKQHPVSIILSFVVISISLLTLSEFIFDINLGIDELFVKDEFRTTATYYAGRMSPLTAINFLFIGSGLLLLNKEKTSVYQYFYLTGIAFIALLMLIGFNFITGIPMYFYLAVHTAIGFILLAAAMWFAQPALQKIISFQIRLFTSFGAIILLIAALSIFSSYYSNKRISTSNWVKHTNDVLSEARQTLSLIKDIESGSRGYIITHDSAYLNYFTIAKNKVPEHISRLKRLTGDNIAQQVRIDSLRFLVDKRIAFSEKMIQARNEKGLDAARGMVATQQGMFYTAEIRAITTAIEQEESELLILRQNENSSSINSFNRAFVIFLICVFLLLVIILFSIRNYIAIGKKAENALSKQNEELEQRVKERIAEIQKNESRFRAIIENNYDIITLIDKDFKVFYRSPSATRIMGWKDEELKDANGIQNIHPDDRAGTMGTIQKLKDAPGKSVNVSFRNRHKNGHYLWVEGSITNLLHDENIKAFVFNFRDITARVEAEAKMIASEERFRAIIEQYPSPVIRYEPDGTHISVNPAWEVMWQDKRENTVGYNIRKDPQMKASGMSEIIEKAFAGETAVTDVYQYDPTLIGKTGRKRWIQLLMYPLKDKEGKILEVILITLDMTDNKEAEEKLIKSEKQYRYLFKSNPMPMWVIDLETFKFLDVNEMAILQYGYSREEFLTMTALDIRPEEDTGLFVHSDHSYKTNDKNYNKGIWRHRKKDGTIIQVEIIAHEILFEGKEARFVLANDVTERKKAEVAILSAEANYREIFEKASDAIYVHEIDTGKVIEVNQRAAEITGYTKEEIIYGNPQDMITDNPLYTMERAFEYLQQAAAGQPQRFDWLCRKKDGSYSWLEVNLKKANIAGEERILAFFSEINDRKKAQMEVQQLNEELEQKVITRTEQLRKTNEELEAFSYSVSHDLRAPLRAIIGFSAILQEDYIDKLDDEAKRITGIIISNTKKMGQLIDDLLTFSRMGRQEILKTHINTGKMVKEIVDETDKKDTGSKKIKWQIHPLPPVMGDINIMRQVWINLISNAAKYSAKMPEQNIEIGSYMQDEEIVFFVKDNGVGFDEKYKNKLFKVFQRLHSADEFDGTGIGLAIVEKIISKHGGKVWAEGEINKGASFYFSLPAGQAGLPAV